MSVFADDELVVGLVLLATAFVVGLFVLLDLAVVEAAVALVVVGLAVEVWAGAFWAAAVVVAGLAICLAGWLVLWALAEMVPHSSTATTGTNNFFMIEKI